MSAQQIYRLRKPVMLMALAAAFPVTTYAAGAASVDFSAGKVVAFSADGKQRQLVKGEEIGNGDTISTGESGRAQVRFTDGAMVSLQPRTEFRIDDYQYSGKADGEEKGFFSLLKGGLRTITGMVGRVNRDRYKVTTGVATIGIRGTGYNAVLDDAVSELAVNTAEGLVEVCNESGCVLLASGESGVVHRDSEPRRTQNNPLLPPAQPEDSILPVFSSGEEKNPDGSPAVVTHPVVPAVVTVYGIGGSSSVVYADAIVVYNGDGSLNSFSSGGLTSSQGTGEVAEYGGDSVIKWQRWKNGTMTIDNSPVALTVDQGVHLVWGVPTATLPTSGTATYSSIGGTAPTASTGAVPYGTFNSALMAVNFGTQSVSAAVSFDIDSRSYSMSGSGTISAGNLIDVPGMSVSGCMSACTGAVSGKFYGASAERVGITYKVNDVAYTVTGAAALTK